MVQREGKGLRAEKIINTGVRRFLSVVLAASLALGMCSPAYAAIQREITENENGMEVIEQEASGFEESAAGVTYNELSEPEETEASSTEEISSTEAAYEEAAETKEESFEEKANEELSESDDDIDSTSNELSGTVISETGLFKTETSVAKETSPFSTGIIEEEGMQDTIREALGAATVTYASYNGVDYTKSGIAADRIKALDKAKQMVTIQWTAIADFRTWCSSSGSYNSAKATDGTSDTYFRKGKTYRGIPYSMKDHTYDNTKWKSYVEAGSITTSNMSGTYYDHGKTTTAHGIDCSYFVYKAIAASVGTSNISYQNTATMVSSTKYYTKLSSFSNMLPADIFLKNGHVMMFVGKDGSDYAVFEATSAGSKCRYKTYSASELSSYSAYRFKGFSTSATSVSSISLNLTSFSKVAGDVRSLTATISPANASDKSVVWTSSNESVAKVNEKTGSISTTANSSGDAKVKIYTYAAGTTTITAKTGNGKKATCTVTVKAATPINLTNTATIPNGTYYIKKYTTNSVDYCLGIQGSTDNKKLDGANAYIWEFLPSSDVHGAFEQWVVTHQSSGYYTIKNVGSGKYLTVKGSSSESRTNVEQQAYSSGNTGQLWQPVPCGNGSYMLVPKCGQSRVLHVDGGTEANTTNVHIMVNDGTNASRWVFAKENSILDLNGLLDGEAKGGIDGYGTVDVYLNGQLVADDVGDYYNTSVPFGTSYEIKDIKTASEHMYQGVESGSLSGKIYNDTKVRLSFNTNKGAEMNSGGEKILPEGDYIIAAAGADGTYYLDIQGTDASAPDGTNAWLYGLSGGEPPACDAWTLSYSDGFYTIRQKGSSMALSVAGSDARAGTNVEVHADSQSSGQKWVITWNGTNGYRIQAKCSGYSLDIVNGVYENGTNVRQWSNNSSNAQSWKLIPYRPSQPLENGRYILLTDIDHSYELDVAGDTGDIAEDTNVRIWEDTAPSRYNSFDVTKLDNGYYRIVHAASGKALEVTGGGSACRQNVAVHTRNDSEAQQWAITESGGSGGYVIWTKCGGLVVDVQGGAAGNATNVHQWPYHGGGGQRWTFVRAEHLVSYEPSGGSGAPEAQSKYYKEDLTFDSAIPTRPGYMFMGWGETAGSLEAVYQPGDVYREEADITLYAVWRELEPDFVLPAALREIEEEAFEGGVFRCVQLGENVEAIRNRAFADCSELRYIIIPEGTTYIAADAFEGTTQLTIIGTSGSYAEFYAQKHGYGFMVE